MLSHPQDTIAVIFHQRHQQRWCTFSQYFFHREHEIPCGLSQISDALSHVSVKYTIPNFHRYQARHLTKHVCQKNTKYTKQKNKYAISIKRMRQLKHQVCHLNQKNMPNKTPSTPSQSKYYANQKTSRPKTKTNRLREKEPTFPLFPDQIFMV